MDIKNFPGTTITLGEWPACLRIEPIGHDTRGIFARFWSGDDSQERVELRRRDNEHALFVLRFSDMELPSGWEDSELVWSLHERDNDG